MYPVALDLTDKTCVVVGGGTVATRKAVGLLEASARVVCISPAVTSGLRGSVTDGQVTWIKREYQQGDLQHYRPFMVFAATNQSSVNRQVADEAQAIGALVNMADGSADSDFHTMINIQRPPLTIAVHTDGTSPALARHLLEVIDRAVGDEYATLASWLGELRPQIRQQLTSQPQRQAFYEAVIQSDALSLLRDGQSEAAVQCVLTLIQEWTCVH